MTSPVMDESYMLEALKPLEQDAPSDRLQAGLAMLAIDAHDRKVTRDQFNASMTVTLALAIALGRYEMMRDMRDHLKEHGAICSSDIEITLHEIRKQIDEAQKRCYRIGELLTECPKNEDRIN